MRKLFTVCLCIFFITICFYNIPCLVHAGRYSGETDLGTVDASFWGTASWQNAGMVAIAPDVNGDGIDDILIGGLQSTSNKAFLIFGKSGPGAWSMDFNLSNADVVFTPEDSSDHIGRALAGIGDINGDGFGDLLIGAPEWGSIDPGKVYLFYGRATWNSAYNVTKADAYFKGENINDHCGQALARAGDLDGDGFGDFIIATPDYHEDAITQMGKAYFLFGKASRYANTSLSASTMNIEGSEGDRLGRSVAGGFDINGDGYDDAIVGSPLAGSSSGSVSVILGNKLIRQTVNLDPDAVYRGNFSKTEYSGTSVAMLGDVSGDGLGDFLVGAPMGGTSNSNGRVYVVMGRQNGYRTNMNLTEETKSFVGVVNKPSVGGVTALAGDVNGDGWNDFITGRHIDGLDDRGLIYLVLGGSSGWGNNTNITHLDAARFIGEAINDYAGESIGGGGDVNGDGYDDFIIGSTGSDEGGPAAGQSYLIFQELNICPTSITQVKLFSDPAFTKETSAAIINSTIYVELRGPDGEPSVPNVAIVNVTSDDNPTGFRLRLHETGSNTGIFKGNFTITPAFNPIIHRINSTTGNNVTVYSTQDPTKNDTVLTLGPITVLPKTVIYTTVEDQPFSASFHVNGWKRADSWQFETNSDWMTWNASNHTMTGTPDNSDVGTWYMRINVSSGHGQYDEHNATVRVTNIAPDILGNPPLKAVEDVQYTYDFNSTDDGQGDIEWTALCNNGSWLTMNRTTGVLSGIPLNEHVGPHLVTVRVMDGKGGEDKFNFTITVSNTNDPPELTTKNVSTALEDQLYLVKYVATDEDIGDSLYWMMHTNATSWLNWQSTNTTLLGTPRNADIGQYWVNITIFDKNGRSDFDNFTLTVVNVNDPPVITSIPVTEAFVYLRYRYDVDACDEDVGTTLQYSLWGAPRGMTIDNRTGIIDWIPDVEAIVEVTVYASDGEVRGEQSFKINATKLSAYPPQVTLLTPANETTVDVSTPTLKWSFIDPDSETIYFDVYLGTNMTQVLQREVATKAVTDLTVTSFVPTVSLQPGEVYFWTVIPRDDNLTGNCISSVWWFEVSKFARTNSPPKFLSEPVRTAVVGELYRYDVKVSDADPGDVLTVTLDRFPAGMKIDSKSGSIAWTPTKTQAGKRPVTVMVTDKFVKVLQDYTIWVNNRPAIEIVKNVTGDVGQPMRVVATVHDDDGERLNITLVQHPAGMSISQDGTISWTPMKGDVGSHIITIKVSDGKDDAYANVTIIVKAVKKGNGGISAQTIAIALAIVVGAIVAAVVVLIMRRRGKAPQVAQQGAVDQPQTYPYQPRTGEGGPPA